MKKKDTVPPEERRADTRRSPADRRQMSGAPRPAGDTAGKANRARGKSFRPQAALLNQPAAAAHGQDRTNADKETGIRGPDFIRVHNSCSFSSLYTFRHENKEVKAYEVHYDQ